VIVRGNGLSLATLNGTVPLVGRGSLGLRLCGRRQGEDTDDTPSTRAPYLRYCQRAARSRPCIHYSTTSSARKRIDGGTARPSVLAVLAFKIVWNLTGS
jgi:hypothetical protein